LGGLERIARQVEAIAKRLSRAAKSLPRIERLEKWDAISAGAFNERIRTSR
jgi:hypothetical protein